MCTGIAAYNGAEDISNLSDKAELCDGPLREKIGLACSP